MTTKAELEWRRSKIVELRSRGLNQLEISHELRVSQASISSDMQYLRSQAKQNIKEYTTDHLPEQYQICLYALDTVLKNAFVIMTKSEDDHDKLQALQLFKDTHIEKLSLLSDADTIDHALNFIKMKKSQSKQQSKQQEQKEEEQEGSAVESSAGTETTSESEVF